LVQAYIVSFVCFAAASEFSGCRVTLRTGYLPSAIGYQLSAQNQIHLSADG
jgi:hypothetical protein